MHQGQDNKPRDRKFALLRGKPSDFVWLAHVDTLTDFIRSGFLKTEFRTSGYSSERFVRVSCGMPVLFSLLVAGNSYENISRVGFINNFGSETAGLRENYLYPDNGQDYRYFLSQILGIFEASPAQIQR